MTASKPRSRPRSDGPANKPRESGIPLAEEVEDEMLNRDIPIEPGLPDDDEPGLPDATPGDDDEARATRAREAVVIGFGVVRSG